MAGDFFYTKQETSNCFLYDQRVTSLKIGCCRFISILELLNTNKPNFKTKNQVTKFKF